MKKKLIQPQFKRVLPHSIIVENLSDDPQKIKLFDGNRKINDSNWNSEGDYVVGEKTIIRSATPNVSYRDLMYKTGFTPINIKYIHVSGKSETENVAVKLIKAGVMIVTTMDANGTIATMPLCLDIDGKRTQPSISFCEQKFIIDFFTSISLTVAGNSTILFRFYPPEDEMPVKKNIIKVFAEKIKKILSFFKKRVESKVLAPIPIILEFENTADETREVELFNSARYMSSGDWDEKGNLNQDGIIISSIYDYHTYRDTIYQVLNSTPLNIGKVVLYAEDEQTIYDDSPNVFFIIERSHDGGILQVPRLIAKTQDTFQNYVWEDKNDFNINQFGSIKFNVPPKRKYFVRLYHYEQKRQSAYDTYRDLSKVAWWIYIKAFFIKLFTKRTMIVARDQNGNKVIQFLRLDKAVYTNPPDSNQNTYKIGIDD